MPRWLPATGPGGRPSGIGRAMMTSKARNPPAVRGGHPARSPAAAWNWRCSQPLPTSSPNGADLPAQGLAGSELTEQLGAADGALAVGGALLRRR